MPADELFHLPALRLFINSVGIEDVCQLVIRYCTEYLFAYREVCKLQSSKLLNSADVCTLSDQLNTANAIFVLCIFSKRLCFRQKRWIP